MPNIRTNINENEHLILDADAKKARQYKNNQLVAEIDVDDDFISLMTGNAIPQPVVADPVPDPVSILLNAVAAIAQVDPTIAALPEVAQVVALVEDTNPPQ